MQQHIYLHKKNSKRNQADVGLTATYMYVGMIVE